MIITRLSDAVRLLQRVTARISVAVVSIVSASLTTQAQQPPKAAAGTKDKRHSE